MKYISSADDFFGAKSQEDQVFEAILTPQEARASLNHQLFLLESFDSIEALNSAENILIKNGYNPVFLTLEGAYFETLESLEELNEGLLDTVKSFVSTMTEGGNPIAVVQFVLDIIGAIPFTWAGVPVDIVANILNSAIAFYRGQYLTGVINLAMAATAGFGSAALAPFKFLFKPIAGPAEKLIAALWKGGSAKIAAQEFKTGTLAIEGGAHAGLIAKMGEFLTKIAEFIATTGIKVIRGIVDFINYALGKVTGGILKVPAGVTKWLDELSLKMTSFGKASTEAAETLLKDEAKFSAAAGKTAAEVQAAAKAAGSTDAVAAKIAREFTDIPGLTKSLKSEIMATRGFKDLVAKGASPKIQELYVKGAMTEKMIGNILAKGGQLTSESLIQVLKNPTVAADLAKAGWKGADSALTNAIKAGDTAGLKSLFQVIVETPSATKLLSPKVAKTFSVFKEAPELLISGTKKLSSIQDDLLKFTGKNAYKGISGKAFIAFIIKGMLRGTDCGKYLDAESFKDLDKKSEISEEIDIIQLSSVLSTVNEESSIDLTADEESALQSADPEVSSIIDDQLNSTKEKISEFIKKTSPKNPCFPVFNAAKGEAGVFIRHPKMYKAKGGGDATSLTKPEDFAELNQYTKSVLTLLGKSADIDPQHPLSAEDPYTQAYFSNVVNPAGELDPTQGEDSRLDDVLKTMQDAGRIDADKAADIKEETLKHWEQNTIPTSVQDMLNSSEQINEFKFKVGRLSFIK